MRILSFDPAVKNLAYAIMDINNVDNNIKIDNLSFGTFDLCDNKKVKNCKFEDIIKNLKKYLDTILIDNVDLILIENQPSKLNMISKSCSICIYMYYVCLEKNVKLVSPSKKLSNKEINKLSYRERKSESVRECFLLIPMTQRLLLQQYSKKDDIADAINQAYQYYKNNN